jgi:hypothetical protein
MMADFYTVPSLVLDELIANKRLNKDAKILCPYDPQRILADQLIAKGFTKVFASSDESTVVDPIWWVQQRDQNFDWVLSVSLGLRELKNYVMDYGMQTARKGLIILDRLSFLEPVESRRNFLTTYKLSDIIVFSPRPQFRALGGTKDSVTSAWFIFEHGWMDGPNLSFSINWNRPNTLPPLP